MIEQQVTTEINPNQQAWIDFVATGGVTVDEEGQFKKQTASDLSKEIGVDRTTLYRWRDTIPAFWELVKARRNEIYSRSHMTMIYRAMLKKAVQGDVAAAKLMMNQAHMLEADKQEIEHSGQVTVETVSYADTGSEPKGER